MATLRDIERGNELAQRRLARQSEWQELMGLNDGRYKPPKPLEEQAVSEETALRLFAWTVGMLPKG